VRVLRFLFITQDPRGERVTPAAATVSWLTVALVVSLLFWLALSQARFAWGWEAVFAYREKFLNGWLMTILVSTASLLLSLVVGVATAMRTLRLLAPLASLARLVMGLLPGTPFLVQILIFFYVIAEALGIQNRYLAGIVILAMFAGAYISEIIRAGIESVSETQLETARAIGFTPSQIYRHVIMPQVTRQVLPPLAGQFASLIKDSSLLSVISVSEFTLNAQEVNAFTYSTLESYLPLALGYLVLTLPISLWTKRLEERFRYAT